MELFARQKSVYTNSLTMFAAAWTVSSVTTSSATLDATSQTIALSIVLNEEPKRRCGLSSWFETNLHSAYNIMKVTSMFRAIVEDTHRQRAFDIITLSYHLE